MRFKPGCLKDKKRQSRFSYAHIIYLPVVKLPPKIDYTKKMSAVRNYGDEGTCGSFETTVGMKEYRGKIDYAKLIELSSGFLYEKSVRK